MIRRSMPRASIRISMPTGIRGRRRAKKIRSRKVTRIRDYNSEATMKGLAIYIIVALTGFSIYSLYYAIVGDNAPFWIILVIGCLPIIVFASLYLRKNR